MKMLFVFTPTLLADCMYAVSDLDTIHTTYSLSHVHMLIVSISAPHQV